MKHRSYLRRLAIRRAEAIRQSDIVALRDIFVKACVFAGFTIQCRTVMAERDYDTWIRTGIVGNYLSGNRKRIIQSATEYAATLDLGTFRRWRRDGWRMAQDIETNVSGLGIAKASFAAALAGASQVYCLDRWGLRYATGDEDIKAWDLALGRKDRWQTYRAIGDMAFGDRQGQWNFFAIADATFANTGHEVYFRSVGV